MQLPAHILSCITALEKASYPTYAVGGCVRDWLLGLTPHDYDLCTAATPEQIQAVFSGEQLLLHGVKHGTVGVVIRGEVVEITTFRTEGNYADNRHPDWVAFVTDIKDDLARRDFTINAMAYSPTRGFADPFGGRDDLRAQQIRAVGDPDKRFQEDALRILRCLRFAARYGFSIEENTANAMHRQLELTDKLAAERVFDELCKLLLTDGLDILWRYPAIFAHLIPELAPAVGFDQHSPHHAYDLYSHIVRVTAATPGELPLRWAALLHDVGKIPTFTQDATGRGHFYGHAKESAAMADTVLRRMKAPTALRERVLWLIENHMTPLEPDKKLLRRRISHSSVDAIRTLIDLHEADMGSKGTGGEDKHPHFETLRRLVSEIEVENACLSLKDLAIDGSDLIALGHTPGKAFSACLGHLLDRVLSEQLPNEPDALLTAAKAYFSTLPEETP